MNDELVDIIDKKNKIIGVSKKTDAHAQGLLHKTVIAEVFNANGLWLLVKQSSSRQDAGQFVSPVGGHVQAGESEEDALKREAKEELGIQGFSFRRVGDAVFNRTILNRKENHLFIVYEITSDQPIVLNDESEAYKWFSPDEIKNTYTHNPQLFGDAFVFVLKTFYPKLLP